MQFVEPPFRLRTREKGHVWADLGKINEHKNELLRSGDRPVGWGCEGQKQFVPSLKAPTNYCCALPGCPGLLGVFRKFVSKMFVLGLTSPIFFIFILCQGATSAGQN